VAFSEGFLQITTADGHTFKAEISRLSPWEQAVCNHPKGLSLLLEAVLMGCMWKVVFCRQDWSNVPEEYSCPKALRMPWA
jgi:hypothetical protein